MWKSICLIGYLAILSIFDVRTRKVPISCILAGGAAAVANIVYLCMEHGFWESLPELLKSVGPGILMLIIAKFSGKTGYGDGAVLLVAGAVMGSIRGVTAFMLSIMIAALVSGILLVLGKVSRNDQLPFVPFLAISTLITVSV